MTSVHARLIRPMTATTNFSEVSYFAGLKGEAFSAYTAGDLCILMTCNGGNSQTPPSLLSGWNPLATVDTQASDVSDPIAARIQTKILAPGDSALSAPTGTRISGAILRGVLENEVVASSGSSATTGTTMTFESLTDGADPTPAVLTDLDFVLAFAAFRSDQPIAFPSGFTRKAMREIGEGAPVVAVSCMASNTFAGGTAAQSIQINGGVAFTLGLRLA